MQRYTVTGRTPIGVVSHVIKAKSAKAAKARFLSAHPKAVEIIAVREKGAD